MKTSFLFRFLMLLAVCSLSFLSYRYLQGAKGQLDNDVFNPKLRHAEDETPTKPISSDSGKTNQSQPSALPDVEFLKYVIQKSREGIPVLDIDRWIPW